MQTVILLLLFTFVGCGGAQRANSEIWDDGIYDLRTGTKVDQATLRDAVRSARVVIVGESHDSAVDHQRQVDVIEMTDHAAIGMEMFQRPFQGPLDAFVRGEISEDEMLAQTEWESRWGFETDLYRPFWALAKKESRPLVALNLRRELTKKISGGGVDSLTDEERAELPEHDLSNDAYKTWLREIFESHGAVMDDVKFERFFEAQVMWDETMAESAVAALKNSQQIVLIVGRGHVERDWGIPSRVRRRLGATDGDGTVISIIPSDGKLPSLETLRRQQFADFLWVQSKKK